jgi:hypothetical protein
VVLIFGSFPFPEYKIECSFSCARKKNEPKEGARAPLNPARRRYGRRMAERTDAQTGRRTSSVRSADARRGPKGEKRCLG